MKQNTQQMSKTRNMYFIRLIGRCVVLAIAIGLFVFCRESFLVAEQGGFFSFFSPLHILWAIWMLDMIFQLIPIRAHISIGSQKQFLSLFRPIKEKINRANLKKYIQDTTRAAYKVMIIWIVLTVVLCALRVFGYIDVPTLVMVSVFFYVCDLICVLIWCPFRLIMKNKCCTTCRIFNWDHLMMFLPMVAVNSLYSWTLVGFSAMVWLVWEVCVFTYPERFWENSNMALRCSECTDKLCTQYCRRLNRSTNNE